MYADGTLIGDSNGVYRTDENGEIRITGLTPGKSVVVTETRAPAGFIRFPEMVVRFIAVNDGVDSDDQASNDFTPFRNLVWIKKIQVKFRN